MDLGFTTNKIKNIILNELRFNTNFRHLSTLFFGGGVHLYSSHLLKLDKSF